MQMHLKDVKKALFKKKTQRFSTSVVFLYKELFQHKLSPMHNNVHSILSYQHVLDKVYQFTIANFEDLITIHLNQSTYNEVIQQELQQKLVANQSEHVIKLDFGFRK